MSAESRQPRRLTEVAWHAVVVGTFVLAAVGSNLSVDSDPVIFALTALTAGSLLLRHRWPLPTLLVVTLAACAVVAVGTGMASFELAIAFAVFAVRVAYPVPVAFPAAAGSIALVALALQTWAVGPDGVQTHGGFGLLGAEPGLPAALTPLAIFVATALGLGAGVRSRRQRLAELELRNHQLALERDQREELAIATERTRIAREMHDVAAHSLTTMITLTEGAAASLARDPVRAGEVLAMVADTGRAALSEMRRVVSALRDPDDSDEPLIVGSALRQIEDLAARVRQTGIPTTLTISGADLPADAGLQWAVYRIVQESLTNVLRHAPRSPGVTVLVDVRAHEVVVEVVNAAGPPREPVAAGSGLGLIGIKERAAVHGGRVEAGPTANGWGVHAVLRWETE